MGWKHCDMSTQKTDEQIFQHIKVPFIASQLRTKSLSELVKLKGFALNRQDIVRLSNRIGVILFNYKFECPSISL